MTGLFFQGNAPAFSSYVFMGIAKPMMYYLPGATGWTDLFKEFTRLWNPVAQTADGAFVVKSNAFRFNITGTADIPLVVEACASLNCHEWTPLHSLYLTNGSVHFSDPDWAQHPSRLYRLRFP